MRPAHLLSLALRRGLLNREAWRTAGRDEYAFMWNGVSRLRGGRLAMRVVIGGIAVLMFPLSIVMVWHPMGPPDPLRVGLYIGALLASVALGVWWILDPWPRRGHAVFFVVCSDALILLGTAVLGAPASRICGTIYLGMIALLTAVLLGARILALQCAFSLTVLGVYVVTAQIFDGATLLDLYVYVAPAVTMEVGLPLFMQVIVELSRRGMTQIFTERNRDALTGLYSRQGMRLALRTLVRERRLEFCVVAMLDLDRFKQFNDAHGHPAGDLLLARTARTLRAELDGAVIARMGGDEFLLYAMRPSRYGADSVVRTLRRLVMASSGVAPIRGSIGAVVVRTPDAVALERAAVQADRALYEAKRDRSLRIVVRTPEDVRN
ncbi:diguanylate cyclase [Tsukamurella paurometabola DSM 20162]|uniref:Diguanylate cyclase n=1 Tax=Tsukamurella paurometabola (strain ATCC 8368 / DSM 20162 / CCUG 35730 / CIP 100753 / JCM 10117 / KCTC 9821 / NBRC 16120 / NCIMB 702349 / NCTC 13040) TaxID=521096 RepID=D5UNV1_TSUPD|nr:diguanylate cyclase [Tsukamurella paurometabola DSM 20162]